MNTSFVFQKATKKRAKARVAIDGPSGAGKTFTGLMLAKTLAGPNGKIAVIDTERGSASLYSDKFDFDVLELNNFSPETYTNAIKAAENGGYTVIMIDSLSHAWEGEGGALDMVDQKAARLQGNSYAAWKDVTPMHRRMVDTILQSPAHFVVTMRSKMDYVQEKDDRGKTIIRKVGMAPIQRQGMEYEFTLVADMDVDHRLMVSKSRCDFMADKTQMKPGADFWTPFVAWLNDGAEAPKPEPAKPIPAPQPTQTTPAAVRPYAPEVFKIKAGDMAKHYADKQTKVSEFDRKVIAACIDNIFNGEKSDRYAVCQWLFGHASTKDMTDAEVKTLMVIAGVTDFDQIPSDNAITEFRSALPEALKAQGQQALI